MNLRYIVIAKYPGPDPAYDLMIEKTVGKSSSGSGFSFLDNYRDLEFDFKSREAASKAAKLLRDMRPKKRGTQVKVYLPTDEEHALLEKWAKIKGQPLKHLVMDAAIREAVKEERRIEREEWRAHEELMACVEKVH